MDTTATDNPTATAVRPQRRHQVQICYFNTWADRSERVDAYLDRLPHTDLRSRTADSGDASLLRKARLDCDWYGENARCFAGLMHPELDFSPAHVAGAGGLLDWAKLPCNGDEKWLITMGQQPQALGRVAGGLLGLLRKSGIRTLYYAFDEASRFMPCFREIAPHLDVLIHDEAPLDPAGAAALRPDCLRLHRSWVANLLPYAASFNPAPEKKILFLGSQLGLTDHRRRQIDFLQRRFRDRFVASHDHSVSVADRLSLNRFKVSVCPEGRKFTTPAMSRTHTDRPFWSGCLGLVPVAENSAAGDRLDDLAAAGLILRYPHGDLQVLADRCEEALEMSDDARRRIYTHFNEHETIGTVVASSIAAVSARPA